MEINIPPLVKTIPDRCFSGCSSLTDAPLPTGVGKIGQDAFAGCTSITELILTPAVSSIGSGAFRGMSSLSGFTMNGKSERFTVKDGVLYSNIGNSLYLIQYPAAKEADTYEIDAATAKISKYAFSNTKITSIVIGGKISSIEKGAFEGCKSLVSVTITSNAVSFYIDADAFKDCCNLKVMKIELSKAPTLSASAFEGVSSTFSVYVTSDMIRSYQTASNWRNISERIFSLGTIFGSFAVEEVEGGYTIRHYFGTEKEVVIPEILNAKHIVGISENAFSFSSMEKITVSKYVTNIGDNAFAECTSLRAVILECEPPILGSGAFNNVSEDFGIYIKNTTQVLDAYRQSEYWKELSEYIWSYQ